MDSEYLLQLFGYLCGYLATGCFTIQYFPQALLNFSRKSVEGFSEFGIALKLLGASFLFANSSLLGGSQRSDSLNPLPITLYGLFNVVQHSFFFYQFYLYGGRVQSLYYLSIPIFSYFFGALMPMSIQYTLYIKPLCQILSHFPQLYTCIRDKSTKGVSLQTQHLNVIGGAAGLIMCYMISVRNISTILLYVNSLFQAFTLYFVAVMYNGNREVQLSSKNVV